jgi:hypothetical protein
VSGPDATSEEGLAPQPAPKPRRRGRRILAWVLGSIGALLLIAIIGIVVWSQV